MHLKQYTKPIIAGILLISSNAVLAQTIESVSNQNTRTYLEWKWGLLNSEKRKNVRQSPSPILTLMGIGRRSTHQKVGDVDIHEILTITRPRKVENMVKRSLERDWTVRQRIFKTVRFMNTIKYSPDTEDWWQSPQETLKNGSGDCEDRAILAYYFLRELNVSCYLTLGILYKGNKSLGGHVWITFSVGTGEILDVAYEASKRNHYVPLVHFTEQGVLSTGGWIIPQVKRK